MDIAVSRDIVIIVFGITGTVFFILIFLMFFSLYRRSKLIFNSINQSMTEIKTIFHETGKAIKPIMQVTAVIDAAAKGMVLVNQILGTKKGGQENGQGTMD